MASLEPSVCAVIVSYNPEPCLLSRLITVLLHQVTKVAVVDNGSNIDVRSWVANEFPTEANLDVILLGDNLGVASAQNAGITWARGSNSNYVIFFDQDSEPANNMVKKLIFVAEKNRDAGCLVAAVGPRYIDERQNNPPPFIRVKGLRLERDSCLGQDDMVQVDYLISSGCLIPTSALDAVGGMRDDLFIDYVDIEWGLRARYLGFQSYGACSAFMKHNLGEQPIAFFSKRIPFHSALRHYYHFRNALLLYKEPWVPLNWKIVDGWRLCLKFVFYVIYAHPRRSHLRMMVLGIWHGLKGRSGKYE